MFGLVQWSPPEPIYASVVFGLVLLSRLSLLCYVISNVNVIFYPGHVRGFNSLLCESTINESKSRQCVAVFENLFKVHNEYYIEYFEVYLWTNNGCLFICSCASRTDMMEACDSRNLELLQKEFPLWFDYFGTGSGSVIWHLVGAMGVYSHLSVKKEDNNLLYTRFAASRLLIGAKADWFTFWSCLMNQWQSFCLELAGWCNFTTQN